MRLMSKIETGAIRIDFDPNMIRRGGLEEISKFVETAAKTSKIIWVDDPLALRNGIIIGHYNQFITTDSMAERACRSAEKYIRQFEK